MNFIAVHLVTWISKFGPKQPGPDLGGHFFSQQFCLHIQQAQAGHFLEITLHTQRIQHLTTQHLIATANAHHSTAFGMKRNDCLSNALIVQIMKIVEGILAAGENYQIHLKNLLGRSEIGQIHRWLLFQAVEVRVV